MPKIASCVKIFFESVISGFSKDIMQNTLAFIQSTWLLDKPYVTFYSLLRYYKFHSYCFKSCISRNDEAYLNRLSSCPKQNPNQDHPSHAHCLKNTSDWYFHKSFILDLLQLWSRNLECLICIPVRVYVWDTYVLSYKVCFTCWTFILSIFIIHVVIVFFSYYLFSLIYILWKINGYFVFKIYLFFTFPIENDCYHYLKYLSYGK